jgi:ATP adenylyltransferase
MDDRSASETPGQAGAPGRPLWAPWRIEYILGPRGGGCFFCRKGESPEEDEANHVLARGRSCFVLMNDYPYNSGHIMVAPYRHVGDIQLLSPEERAELMELTAVAQDVLRQTMRPDGFNFGINIGDAGGAGVREHLHAHLVPRWVGDTNFMAVLADTRVVPDALVRTAALLRDAWPSRD